MNDADRLNDATIEERARAVFERSVAELDAATRARLGRARDEALKRLTEPRPAALPWRPATWAAAGVAAALALSFAWLLPDGAPHTATRAGQLAASPDIELLLDDDELDMLQDLDFYSWLGQQTRRSAPAGDDGIG